jgi:hypothetical protein
MPAQISHNACFGGIVGIVLKDILKAVYLLSLTKGEKTP